MKVSLNWIKQFIDFDLPPVDELADKIGAQLGAIEEIIETGKKYNGALIVKVVECTKHENSDHLNVCKVDDGGKASHVERDENGLVQVVCGAPNAHIGMLAVWLPPGSTVPSTVDKDPFVLEARALRGVTSNGMMASPKELAIGDGHEGLLEVDKDVAAGTPFADAYNMHDTIIDIENKMFTHRPDCFGALGVAREIAGILGHQFKSPDWYKTNPDFPGVETDELQLEVQNDIPNLVSRFTAITLRNVEVKPSPVWLQATLSRVGQKPINNIVDLANFWMLVTGQPLHAYDADKIATGKLGVRNAKGGEKLALLNGKTVELNEADMVITDGEKAIGLGGVMGGSETEVSAETKNVIIECATFDMYAIRRTSMRHGLFTDAVTRFTKGQSPLQNLAVLAKIVGDVQKMASGKVASQVVDVNPNMPVHEQVHVTSGFINTRLGLQLSTDEMAQLLKNVEFEVAVHGDELAVTAPFWRTDIEIKEDVVEEIGRLYGYDHLPLTLPKRDITPAVKDELIEAKATIRARLAKTGASEVLTYSFVHGDLLDKVGQDKAQAYQLDNALSPDLQYFRPSLLPSLLDKIHLNLKAGYGEFALFELGKLHTKERGNDNEGLPAEDEMTALVIAANDKHAPDGAPFYAAQKYLGELLHAQLVFKPLTAEAQTFAITKPYQPGRAAFVSLPDDEFLGIIGEFRPSVARALKLPKFCAGFEVDTKVLAKVLAAGSSYSPLPRFPKVTQDLTLKVNSDKTYLDVFHELNKALDASKIDQTQTKLEPLDIFQPAEDTSHKNFTFRFTVASYERTLTDAEVAKVLDAAAAQLQQKLGAVRV